MPKALHLLKVVSVFDWSADSIVLLHLYRALVRSRPSLARSERAEKWS